MVDGAFEENGLKHGAGEPNRLAKQGTAKQPPVMKGISPEPTATEDAKAPRCGALYG